jgi:hypothetical protein
VFHVSLLKKYVENPEDFQDRVQKVPPPIIVDGQEEYEVEGILDKRIKRFGNKTKVEYLVKWKNYPEYDATWEPEDALGNAQDSIQDFNEMSGRHS